MGVRYPFLVLSTSANVTITAATETIILTTPAFNPPLDFALVLLLATVQMVYGTAITVINFRLRQGTTVTGALVTGQTGGNFYQKTAVATNQDTVGFISFDNPGAVGGQQYVLTAQQTSATGNGTVNVANLAVLSL